MDFWQRPPDPLLTASSAPPSDPKANQPAAGAVVTILPVFFKRLMRMNRITNNETFSPPPPRLESVKTEESLPAAAASHVSATLACASAHSSPELKQKDGIFSRRCLAARVFPAQEEAPLFFTRVTCLFTCPHDRDVPKLWLPYFLDVATRRRDAFFSDVFFNVLLNIFMCSSEFV